MSADPKRKLPGRPSRGYRRCVPKAVDGTVAMSGLLLHRDGLALVNAADLSGLPESSLSPELQGACETIAAWAYTYLCRPHARLGREGPVCPFTQAALRRES